VPGAVEARIVSLRRGNGAELDPARWSVLLDRTLAGAGDRFAGGRALVDVARYGHFTEAERPWERLGFRRRWRGPAHGIPDDRREDQKADVDA